MQKTLARRICFSGNEVFGGRAVDVTISPSASDTGITFLTESGAIPASLEFARQYKSSILLQKGDSGVIHVEHLLATLFAYGVDNCVVKVKRLHRIRTTNIDVIPLLKGREMTLCALLDGNIVEQPVARRMLCPTEILGDDQLQFIPRLDNGLIIEATTDYKPIGKQYYSTKIDGANFKEELAMSRSYVKHKPDWIPLGVANFIAKVLNPEFGYGHNFIYDEFFFPQKNKDGWVASEIYPAEIARHTIVDRLGAIALLRGRLAATTILANGSGHKHDIDVLRSIEPKLSWMKDPKYNHACHK